MHVLLLVLTKWRTSARIDDDVVGHEPVMSHAVVGDEADGERVVRGGDDWRELLATVSTGNNGLLQKTIRISMAYTIIAHRPIKVPFKVLVRSVELSKISTASYRHLVFRSRLKETQLRRITCKE